MKNLKSYENFENQLLENGWSGEHLDANFKLDGNEVIVTFDKAMTSAVKKVLAGKNDPLLDTVEDEIRIQLGREIDWDQDVEPSKSGIGMRFVLEHIQLFEGKASPGGEIEIKELQDLVDDLPKTVITQNAEYDRFDRNFNFEFTISGDNWQIYYDKLAKSPYLLNLDSGTDKEIVNPLELQKLLKSF